MQINLFLAIAVAAVASGCGRSDSSSSSGSSGSSPVTAPVDYLNSAVKAEKRAETTVDTVAINAALQMFNVSEGRNPTNLNELVEKKYMPKLPEPPFGMQIVYDAASGTVKVVKR